MEVINLCLMFRNEIFVTNIKTNKTIYVIIGYCDACDKSFPPRYSFEEHALYHVRSLCEFNFQFNSIEFSKSSIMNEP